MTTIAELTQKIGQIKDRVENLRADRSTSLNEAQTKATLIAPLLRAVGWDIEDHQQVQHEFRPSRRDEPVDYCLLIDRKPVLMIEAKQLGYDIKNRKFLKQISNYANVAGLNWCAISNGNDWILLDRAGVGDISDRIVAAVSIIETSCVSLEEFFSLLTAQSLQGDAIGCFVHQRRMDQTLSALKAEMLAGKNEGFVDLLSRNSGYKPNEVRAWLAGHPRPETPGSPRSRRPQTVPTISPAPKPRRSPRSAQPLDTLVVPAKADGFEDVFLKENRWYAVRLREKTMGAIKYLAAYQCKPISSITHVATVARIEPFGDAGKFQLIFSGPPRALPRPIPLGRAKPGTMQGPRYTSYERLIKAKEIADLDHSGV